MPITTYPAQKPYVICHMETTLDGRITSRSGEEIMADYFKIYTQAEDQLKGDSWMLWRVTLGMFTKIKEAELPRRLPHGRIGIGRSVQIGVDGHGQLPVGCGWRWRFHGGWHVSCR